MIKTIIFDFGNVISNSNSFSYCNDLEKLTGIPAQVFKSVYDNERTEFDRGTITGAEMYASLLCKKGYSSLAKNEDLLQKIVLYDLKSWFSIRDDVTQWGLFLQKQGYKLGILSNMPKEFLDLYEKKITLFTSADFACFSCRCNTIKPEKFIYQKCLKGLDVLPEEAVFFDDISVNITAAKQLGIHGYLWTGIEQGKKDWNNIITTQS